jgi:hypothetical protein
MGDQIPFLYPMGLVGATIPFRHFVFILIVFYDMIDDIEFILEFQNTQ